jgi:hypothetical protein
MNLLHSKKWLIHRGSFLFGLFILIGGNINTYAQFSEVEFFNRVNSIYYTLEQTDLKNFTCWLTSNIFINATEGFFKEEVFPLEFIWMSGNRMYFSRRALPVLGDTTKDHLVDRLQESMRTEFRALLLDWQRFYSGRLLQYMPPDYKITVQKDTVVLTYKSVEDTEDVVNTMLFGKNGICLKTTLAYPSRGEKIDTYPLFKYTGEKWLCIGWQVQVYEGAEISTGYQVEVKSQRVDKYWLPQVFSMTLQTSRDKKSLYVREYYFRNILVNRKIEVMN